MTNALNRIFDQLRHPEKKTSIVEIKSITEQSGLYPFSKDIQLSTYISSDTSGVGMGFSENSSKSGPDGQLKIGQKLAKIIDPAVISQGVLDVGYGTNTFVSEGLSKATNCPVVLLDFYGEDKNLSLKGTKVPPQLNRQIDDHTLKFQGNATEINAKGSQLADSKFGLITFNGSWSSDGNNFTTGNLSEVKYRDSLPNQPVDHDAISNHRQSEMKILLSNLKERLIPGGSIYISSSRFALHGDGFRFGRLPAEKMDFVNTLDVLKNIGAKKITIIGLSPTGLKEQLNLNLSDPDCKLSRFTETFYEIFHGFQGNPSRQLTHDGGIKYSALEIGKMSDDRQTMESMMNEPGEFKDKMEEEINLRQQKIIQNVAALCGGLEGLKNSDHFAPFISNKRINELLTRTPYIIPAYIARVDAIMAQF